MIPARPKGCLLRPWSLDELNSRQGSGLNLSSEVEGYESQGQATLSQPSPGARLPPSRSGGVHGSPEGQDPQKGGTAASLDTEAAVPSQFSKNLPAKSSHRWTFLLIRRRGSCALLSAVQASPGRERPSLRIPTKPATHSDVKAATHSEAKAATLPELAASRAHGGSKWPS